MPPLGFPQPLPLAGEGRAWGRGLAARTARRHDDRDKMATLQGCLLESDPGALSPAQVQQLRDFKVGAPPPPRLRQSAAPPG